jgi:hypothetical protein
MRLGKLLSAGEVVEDEVPGEHWDAPVAAQPAEPGRAEPVRAEPVRAEAAEPAPVAR